MVLVKGSSLPVSRPQRRFSADPGERIRSGLWEIVSIGERFLAVTLGLLSLPMLATASIVIIVKSRRGPWVAHRRVGFRGEDIWVLKLRTMWDQSREPRRWRWLEYLHNPPVPERKRPHDVRVRSRFAAFCRRFSIDELPQIWQVVTGTLALVGPRPLTVMELDRFYGRAKRSIIQVKPGLTGLWQVRGRDSLTYRQRRRLDLFMLRKWSFRLYLQILIASVPGVVSGKNAF